nr:hypothetical protein [Tanacetum cinerariifolium]
EDANLKLLRSLPSSWNNIALIMRNKSDLDTLSMDDLYNNLKVCESEIKGQSSSSLNSQNVAFVTSDNSSSTNETVNTASSMDQTSTTSYVDDVMFSFFTNQSNAPLLDNEDLEQIDIDDLKEMDLKWQVAMLTKRVKRNRDASRRNAIEDTSTTNVLVVQDGICGYDWSFQAEEGLTNFALMAYTSQGSSSSDSKVHTCSKECLKSYEALQKQYDQQRETLNKSNLEIIDLIIQLENALKEKDELKLKLEKFETSSKNLTKLINGQISAIDKTGLGYDGQMNQIDLNDIHVNETEVLKNVFDSRESNGDDNQVNYRFKKDEGYHSVPPLHTGNYMPLRADLSFAGLDNSVFKFKESDSEDKNVFKPKEVKKTVKQSFKKIEFVNTRLGNGFEFKKKACFVCGSFNHLIKDYDFYENKMVLNNKGKIIGLKEIRPVWDNTARVNHQSKLTRLHPKRNFVPAAVLTKSGQVLVNAAKQSTHKAVASVSAARRVNIAASRINSYLTDYQEIDGGFVAFRGNAKGGKITRKDKIRTRKLDFEDVYFMKELKFNLFSVSQMRDKKNNVLFTDTECVVLSPDFKLLDESQVLLKDETPEILKNFIEGIENQMDHKVKTIRCDNGTEFKNRIMNEFYEIKGVMREFSVARTLQQNGVAERKNRTLIETAKTMLADSKLPTTFWAEAKTCLKLYETIWVSCYNPKYLRSPRFVKENLHINFLENKPNVTGTGPNGMFDIDTLTMSINYQPDFAENQTNGNVDPKSSEDEVADDAGKKSTKVPRKENEVQDLAKEGEAAKTNSTNRLNTVSSLVNVVSSSFTIVDTRRERAQRNEFKCMFGQDKDANDNSTYRMFTPVCAAGSFYVNLRGSILVNAATLPNVDVPTDPLMPNLEDIVDLQDTRIFSGAYDDEVEGAVANFNNLEFTTVVSPIPTAGIHKDHPKKKITGDPLSTP